MSHVWLMYDEFDMKHVWDDAHDSIWWRIYELFTTNSKWDVSGMMPVTQMMRVWLMYDWFEMRRCITVSIRCTGWRRHIGSPKLQIICHKRATKYTSRLRKMTCKDEGSYESSPPCSTFAIRCFSHAPSALHLLYKCIVWMWESADILKSQLATNVTM